MAKTLVLSKISDAVGVEIYHEVRSFGIRPRMPGMPSITTSSRRGGGMGKSTARLFGKTPERPYLIDTPVGPSAGDLR